MGGDNTRVKVIFEYERVGRRCGGYMFSPPGPLCSPSSLVPWLGHPPTAPQEALAPCASSATQKGQSLSLRLSPLCLNREHHAGLRESLPRGL